MVVVKLFLDDERFPPNDGAEWHIVRTMGEAISYMEENGCPDFISWDHDLGQDEPTGYDLVNWMIDRDLDLEGSFIPKTFTFYVHSQNSVGVVNINSKLRSYLDFRQTI
jgi:hypothetical protein